MNIYQILRGLAMGIAEIIPGVSGGTIAFITGIYERLLNAIKAWNLTNLRHLTSGRFRIFWTHIDGKFLVNLGMGMVLGMVTGVFAITYLMEHYIEPLWGFFFGLIIASVLLIFRQVHTRDWIRIALFFAGTLLVIGVIRINPVEGNTALWFVFLSGVIAISALMMPGISGSFMLLILGMYGIIIPAFKSLLVQPGWEAFRLIFVFGLGLLTGLLSFSRVLSWTYKHFQQSTLMVLTGFLVGSLYKIWPWRMPSSWMNKITLTVESDPTLLASLSKHDYRVISEKLVLPGDYFIDDPKTGLVIGAAILGFLLVWLLDKAFQPRNVK